MNPTTPTLLYIDDDAALARLVERGLTRLGFTVVHAASGTHGLERLEQGGIDVVALDQAGMAFVVFDHDDFDWFAHECLFRLPAAQLMGSVIVNVLPL